MPGGPVATIGATTESHPLMNYFSGACLLTSLGGKENRLGPIGSAPNARGQLRARDFLMEMMLIDAEGSLEKPINLQKLRRDQVLTYSLLGDPATRLRLPQPLQVSVEHIGRSWRWRVAKPPQATHLEVGYRSASPLSGAQTAKAGAEGAGKAFVAANAGFAFRVQTSPPDGGPWEGTCDRPGWLCLVVTGPGAFSAAAVKLE